MSVNGLSADDLATIARSPLNAEQFSPAYGVSAVVVPLDKITNDHPALASRPRLACVVVGTSRLPPSWEVAQVCDLILTEEPGSASVCHPGGVEAGLEQVLKAVEACPLAAATLIGLLRGSGARPAADALYAESLAYSALQAGPEFVYWLQTRSVPSPKPDEGPPVRLERRGDTLEIVLSRPRVHNAFDTRMRDALAEALALAVVDESIRRIELSGKGWSFCSGGDLTGFGTFADPANAHVARMTRNIGLLFEEVASRMVVTLHGVAVGAGIELAAFARHVRAQPGTTIALPELRFGLIPGAGGTVSVTRRIGRHRAAWLALSGQPLDVETAIAWGLVDELAPL